MTIEEQIIEIIKLEAHKNLTIVDEGIDSCNDYVIRGVDLMAKSLVKLFTTPDVVGRREQFISLIRELIDVGIIDEDDIEVETWVNNYLKEINFR